MDSRSNCAFVVVMSTSSLVRACSQAGVDRNHLFVLLIEAFARDEALNELL
jgi:hypothetical protein